MLLKISVTWGSLVYPCCLDFEDTAVVVFAWVVVAAVVAVVVAAAVFFPVMQLLEQ